MPLLTFSTTTGAANGATTGTATGTATGATTGTAIGTTTGAATYPRRSSVFSSIDAESESK